MIFRTAEPPEWLEHGANFGEEGADLSLDRCMIAVCKLRAHAFALLRRLKTASVVEKLTYLAKFQDVVAQAEKLDLALSDWCSSLSEDWFRTTHLASAKMWAEFSPTPAYPYFPKTTHIYGSLHRAIQLNRYRSLRFIANGLVFKAINWQRDITGTDPVGGPLLKARASSNFQVLTDGVCASIAYFFALLDDEQENEKVHSQAVDVGRIGKLSWILTVCVATPELPCQQRNWVKRMLNIFGEIADFPIL